MSSSSEIIDSGKFSGQKTAKSPEKSSFSQTCNLLSQYLKEKRTLGDLSLGMAFESNGTAPATPPAAGMTMNLFPVKQQPENAQMTIFYGGQVMVFNDFPSEKAKEIMMLASKACSAHKQAEVPASPNVTSLAKTQRPPQPIVSDLPIARKASLTRFLEKRKDRITARAPYGSPVATKPAETKSWLGLAATDSPVKFEQH